MQLIKDRKILLIGNVALQLREKLLGQGMNIAGVITPVNGFNDAHRVIAEAAYYDFDIALIAAGIAAIPIAVHLSGISGKVAFDFGHLANLIAGISHPARQ